MAAHAHLKNEFTEDEKYHNLMSWLKLLIGEGWQKTVSKFPIWSTLISCSISSGVAHGQDLQYVFGFPYINETYLELFGVYPRQEYDLDFSDRNISEHMISLFTNFSDSGYVYCCMYLSPSNIQGFVNQKNR